MKKIKEIRKALQETGEARFGDIEIILYDMIGAEVTQSKEYIGTFGTWYELEEYLEETL